MPAIDAPVSSVALSAQPWLPTPSPTLRLSTPTLDPLPIGAPPDWSHALSSANPPLYPPPNLPTGLTPRFSPAFPQLQSPGVSAEIAANPTDHPPPSQSLSDLFRCSEYPFTTAGPAKPAPDASRPHPPKAPLAASQPVPSSSAAALHGLKHPAYRTASDVTQQSRAQPPHQQHSQPQQHHQQPQPQPQPPQPPPPPPPPHSQQQQQQQRPLQPQPPPFSQPPFSQPAATFPVGRPDNVPSLPPRAAGVPTPIAPVPDLASAALNVGGQRAVLGSGVVSTAVQEAQVRARMKAESFAKARKRKRNEQPTEADKAMEKINEEESKLSPEQLKKKRYERRLALNRESAAVSRVRRREYVKLLEEQLVNAEKERVRLATELSDMQKQHNKLKDHLRKLENEI